MSASGGTEMEFLDTNLIIRFITRDHPEHSPRARLLFSQLEAGTATVTTCEGFVIEAVQVLSSRILYHLPREEIRDKLGVILDLRSVRLANKRLYHRALEVYAVQPALDFVDALAIAHMEHDGISTIVSFDKGFDKVPGIRRREP